MACNEVVLLTTVPKGKEGLARDLVERKLAGCVSLFPVKSVYVWKGSIEGAEEVQMLIKTTEEKLKEIEAFFEESHPYEVPELILIRGEFLGKYREWLHESLCGEA